jgi:hypothetical protein
MSRAFTDMIDGAIGFTEPGYRAPPATRPYDFDGPVTIEANAQGMKPTKPHHHSIGQSAAAIAAHERETKTLARLLLAALRKTGMVPHTAREMAKAIKHEAASMRRVASILARMAEEGRILRHDVPNPNDRQRTIALYWYEAR